MASRRQATAGAVHEVIEVLRRHKSVRCGLILALTESRAGQVQCVVAPYGSLNEHAAGLAEVLRHFADEIDPPVPSTLGVDEAHMVTPPDAFLQEEGLKEKVDALAREMEAFK